MINRYYVISVLLLASFVLSVALTPTERISDTKSPVDLEKMIPEKFGDWVRVNDQAFVSAPTAELRTTQSEDIYQQVLMRTYKNTKGERVMLAIAYGDDQSDSLQMHKPEVCYVFQGFRIVSMNKNVLVLANRKIPVKQLVAINGGRVEPITYWVTVGDKVVRSGIERKIEQLKFGLLRKIPDGFLIRVSTITRNREKAFAVQADFLSTLVASVSPDSLSKFLGDQEGGGA